MVEAFIIAYNEELIIKKTISYYSKFCERITVFDNFSEDGTRDISIEAGANVKLFGQRGVLSDREYLKVKNHCWKNSKADWVIVCDCDEILLYPDSIKEDCTIFQTYGWNVYSNEIPEYFPGITTGHYDGNYSKSVFFNPKLIKEINYHYGCHVANPKGDVRFSKEILTLFHYRNIGGFENLSKRHAMYRGRMSDHNKELGLGCHYLFDEKQRKKEWYQHLENSGEYVPPGGSYVSPQILNLNQGLRSAVNVNLEGA